MGGAVSELKAALLGTIIGGVISAGISWMQGNMAREKDLAMEKRQKLEMVVEHIARIESCAAEQSAKLEIPEECHKEVSSMRLQMLTQLYFPEMADEVHAYTTKALTAQLKMTNCYLRGKLPGNLGAREQCRAEARKDAGAMEAGLIMKKAQAIAKSLQ